MVTSLNIGTFNAELGRCSTCCEKGVFVASDDFYVNCSACLKRVADALDKLELSEQFELTKKDTP